MLSKKFLVLIVICFVLPLLYFAFSQTNLPLSRSFSMASSIHPQDQNCYNLRGSCQWHSHSNPWGPCTIDGKPGFIQPNLCNSDSSLYYRCCRPIDEGNNSPCADKGGKCIWLSHTNPSGPCGVNGKTGSITPNLCHGAASQHYRCCIPDEQKEPDVDEPQREERPQEDYVISNRGCAHIGGECQFTNNPGRCTMSDGSPGCYVFGLCRERPLDFSEKDLYLCCVPEEEGGCESVVDYDRWDDIYIDTQSQCPFSTSDENERRLACWQGPKTGTHRQSWTGGDNFSAIDIPHKSLHENGSEYFIAPDSGTITYAKQRNRSPSSGLLDGGVLTFETDGGITYTLRHVFVFAPILQAFDEGGAGEYRGVQAGDVIAKIALRSDNKIIAYGYPPHFHVEVKGIDLCTDCYFVDELGCDLFNYLDKDGCGRCHRTEPIGDFCEHCNTCPDGIQYCCFTDCNEDEECCRTETTKEFDPRTVEETVTTECVPYE